MQLTAAQRAVVEHRGSALLVSAAAGSGKTKVLVDRLLGMVCDPVRPQNIDDFLIITYTNAAAAELRGKIAAALSERLAEDPANRHLQRQMNRLYLTQISTVHAFCAELLRTYAHQLDIPADFRVAEEMECDVLRQRCLERAMEDSYNAASESPEIRGFIDTMGLGRDDRRAGAIVLQMYRSALCHPDPEGWMEECLTAARAGAETDPLQTSWGSALLEETRRQLRRNVRKLRQAIAAGENDEKLKKAYVPVFQQDAEMLEQILSLETWDEIGRFSNPDFKSLGTVRNCEDPQAQAFMKAVRKSCKDSTKRLLQPFAAPAEQVMADQQGTAQAVAGMFSVLRRFIKLYQAEKRRRHMLDFSDLEQGAVRLLLVKGSLHPTAAAREVANRYREILVDEYQDTNEVQDRIFSAVSQGGKNLFMVGDVKQSIYRFRLADPTIFLEKYQTFANWGEAAEAEPCKILLSENFRSDPEILDAANCVFRAVMSQSAGGLEYGDAEALRAGINRPVVGGKVELHCIETRAEEPDDGQTPERPEAEAEFVARRIAQMLQSGMPIPDGDGTRPVRAQDITILLRSLKSDARYYLSALRRLGIQAECDAGGSILDTVELEALTATLQILDNPHQDIPLAAAMTSPIFGISNDMLGRLRVGRRTGDLFDAVCDAAQSDKTLGAFLTTLRQLQQQAGLLRLHELMQLLENRLSLRKIFGAMPQGRQRVQNLNAFFDLAAQAGPEKTLGQFVRDLAGLKERGVSGGTAAQGADAVRIMSIHKSKGLEFPVVFLAGLSKRFNLQDLAAPVLTDPQLGIGCNFVDADNRVTYPTAAKKAIAQRLQQQSISEEMRVLYVAMTRPKHRLVMSYCSAHLKADLNRLAAELMAGGTKEAAEGARCMGDWVLLTALTRTEAGELFELADCTLPADVSEIPWIIRYHRGTGEDTAAAFSVSSEERKQSVSLPDPEQLRRQYAFVYPHAAATVLPTKITATQLKGRTLDAESAEEAANVLPVRRFHFEKPRFSSEQRGLTPTERGTATHLAMQFIRYEACRTPEGIQAELERLVEQHYLTALQRDAVNADGIYRFFASELGRRVLQAEQVVREFKFSVLVDGGILAPEAKGEQVLLQGVTDCCMVAETGITVIDFKTDRVRRGEEEQAAAYYKGQMEAYSAALARIFKKPVSERILYFFATDTAVSV